jgi:hypothetical protein
MTMKRVWAHVLAGVSLLAGAGIVMPACVHNDSSLFVQDVLQSQFVTAGQTCDFTTDPTQPAIPSGILDVALRDTYNPWFLLGNQLVSQSNSQQLQTETSIITVQGAVVKITDSAGNQLNTFTVLGTTTVYPATGTTPGYAPISVTTIDAPTAVAATAGLAKGATVRLVTYTQFFGNTLGGEAVQSDDFEFPVDLCSGCLVLFSAADDNPSMAFPQPNCNLASAAAASGTGTTSSLPSPCTLGQDLMTDCSQCLGNAACNPQ